MTVKPEYQKQGIGKRMVNACISFVDRLIKESWQIKIVIVSAKGKELIYERLGFEIRPNINIGAGIQIWRTL